MTTAASDLALRPWTGLDGLRAVLGEARAVFDASGLDPLCNDPRWTLAYAEAFVPPETLFGWVASTPDGSPVGFLAFRLEPPRGRFALPRALLLADGTFDSEYLDLPILPGFEEAVVSAMFDGLALKDGIEAVVMTGLPNDSRAIPALRRTLRSRRLPCRERSVSALAAPLPASFEAYVDGLKPRMRSKVRQALRTAEEAGARFAWCADPQSLEAHLEDFYGLHARRWQAEGRPSSFDDPRRRAFYARITPAALSSGELRFARFEHDGRALAYQFGIQKGATYYQIQEGFDPASEELRAPTALRALTIRALIADGVRSYDFMEGDSRHKRDWGGEPRPCTTIAFALPRWRARIAYGLRAWLDRR